MGADAPIPPLVMTLAAPEGAPPRRFIWFNLRENQSFSSHGRINLPAQRCPSEVAERPPNGVGWLLNSITNIVINFQHLYVNGMSSCSSLNFKFGIISSRQKFATIVYPEKKK